MSREELIMAFLEKQRNELASENVVLRADLTLASSQIQHLETLLREQKVDPPLKQAKAKTVK